MKIETEFTGSFFNAHGLNIKMGILFIVMMAMSLTGISQPVQRSSRFPDPGSLPDEKILLIPDRNIYLCGEEIVFEAFTYEGIWFIPIVSSSIIYVELYNTENKVISKGKYILENGRGSGRITIPRETLSGCYFIRAYTNFMKNFGISQFFTGKLKIVNPFLGSPLMNPTSVLTDAPDTILTLLTYLPEKFNIAVETDRKEYGNREKICVKIKATNKDGVPVKSDFTLISVLTGNGNYDTVYSDRILIPIAEHSATRTNKEGIIYLPEIKGDIISGRAVYDDNQPAAGIEVLQSFTGKSTHIESSVTDHNGRFFFLTETSNNNGNLILKVKTEEKKVNLIPDDEFFNDFPSPTNEPFLLKKEEIELISKQFVNIQVEDAFPKKDETGKLKTADIPAFYGRDYAEYKFPDYLKLPNMKEFIFEVIEGVICTRENKKDILSIHGIPGLDKIGPSPLMVIDGVPVSDASIILGLPSEKVKYIRVVRNKYLYKDQSFDGILDIVTYTEDATSFNLPAGTFRFNFTHPDTGVIKIEAKVDDDQIGKIPIYKNLLYWNSNISTDSSGNAEISFISPDNSGIFEINCFGFGREGTFGAESIKIIVGKN